MSKCGAYKDRDAVEAVDLVILHRRLTQDCWLEEIGVVIPKELRDELGIEPGDEVSFWRHEDHVALRPSGRQRPLRGRFRGLRDVIDARLPDERVVLDAARIKADHPMAFADTFAVALSVAQDATLWTGDLELLLNGVGGVGWTYDQDPPENH